MTNDQTKAEYLRKVEWLRRYRDAQRTERRLIEELAQLRAEAASVSQALSGAPSGGGDGSDSEARPADEAASWRWRSAPVFASERRLAPQKSAKRKRAGHPAGRRADRRR